jgi:hypothetical protein
MDISYFRIFVRLRHNRSFMDFLTSTLYDEVRSKRLSLRYLRPGLFTSQDRRNCKAAAYEAAVNYREQVATQQLWED